MRTYYSECRQWLTTLLSLADEAPIGELAKAWKVLGTMAYRQGNYPAALAAFDTSFTGYRQLDDWLGQAAVLNNQAIIFVDQGRLIDARTTFEEAIRMYRRLPSPDMAGIGNTLTNLGYLVKEQGDYPASQRYLEESLAIRRTQGNKAGVALALLNYGWLAFLQGEYTQAQTQFRETRALCEALGNHQLLAECIHDVGATLIEQGDWTLAHASLTESLEHHQRAGYHKGKGLVSRTLGYLCLLQQDWDAASRWLDRAQENLETVGVGQKLAALYLTRSYLADAQSQTGAAQFLERAARQATAQAARRPIIDCLEQAALLLLRQDNQALASRLWQAAESGRAAWTMPRPPSLTGLYGDRPQALDAPVVAQPVTLDEMTALLTEALAALGRPQTVPAFAA